MARTGMKYGVVVVLMLLAVVVTAQMVKKTSAGLDDLQSVSPRTFVGAGAVTLDEVRSDLAVRFATRLMLPPRDAHNLERLQGGASAFDRFITENGGEWRMMVDRRSGLPALIEGSGLPWVPGKGNSLLRPAMGQVGPIGPAMLERMARTFMNRNQDLFPIPQSDLVLMPEATGEFGGYLQYITFQYVRGGVPVDRAYVVFRLNHGNLVQFGSELVAPHVIADSVAALDAATAREIVAGYVGGSDSSDEWVEPGKLSFLPLATGIGDEAVGDGIEYRLVYTTVFRRPGVLGTWLSRVDAQTGAIIAFVDGNDYGSVTGGIYPVAPMDTEVERPLASLTVTNGTTKYTDIGGNYTFATGTASGALTGKYVKVVDSCGASSLSTSTSPGNLVFGKSTGTDCTTPGVGGAGNTHAARTSYYALTNWKLKAQTWLPSNTWLQGQLTDNVNLNQTCNAYWNGSSVNMFKSGGGCRNSGELPTVVLHEVGHGLDTNDGNGSADKGTGESYGDTMGFLMTHDSCMGSGFFSDGSKCSGYGDACTTCTGIRDVDYAKHTSGVPHTPLNYVKVKCPTSSTYQGPCGREGHCEGYIAAEAAWDLAVRDLPAAGFDTNTSWFIMERMFYLSRATATNAYTCNSSTFASDGCGTSSWFTTFRVVDDSDGNLANGTPHAAAIYAAFNRHGIGCSTAVNTNNTTCATLAQPTLTATAGAGQVALSWGAITSATRYWVMRNEISSTAGMMKIAEVTATSYTDTIVSPNIPYYYTVLPLTASNSCFGKMAAVKSATPTGGTAPTTYSISGTVSGATASGVTMTLSGAASANSSTDVSGNYTFSGLANGTYTVAPSKAGFTFSPTSTSVTIASASQTGKNFTATSVPTTDTVLTSGVGVAGSVTLRAYKYYDITVPAGATSLAITLTGLSADVDLFVGNPTLGNPTTASYTAKSENGSTTNESITQSSPVAGVWNLAAYGYAAGSYTIKATVTTSTATYSIGGTVSGAATSGVTMTLSGAASATTTTAAGGTYTFSGRANGSYTVTPSLAGYTFSPANYAVTISGANVTGKNFTATATTTTYSISGTVSGAATSGVTMTLSGAASATTTTATGGTYTFSGRANGTYTVTPSKAGFTFSPTSTSVTISGANQTGKNFTATATGGDTALTSGVGVAGTLAQGAYKQYDISVPSGATTLAITLTGLSADIDLYVGTPTLGNPTSSSNSYKSELGGTSSESVTVSSPAAGTWNLAAYGYAAGNYTITATVTAGGGGTTQILLNNGFESGTASWTVGGAVIGGAKNSITPRTGSNMAAFGFNTAYEHSITDNLTQTVTIPSAATAATLNFYYYIKTAETTTSTQYDKFIVTVESTSGTVLTTLTTLSNLNKSTAWVAKSSLSLLAYKGQTVVIRFKGTTDSSLGTSFMLDDVALNVTQ